MTTHEGHGRLTEAGDPIPPPTEWQRMFVSALADYVAGAAAFAAVCSRPPSFYVDGGVVLSDDAKGITIRAVD